MEQSRFRLGIAVALIVGLVTVGTLLLGRRADVRAVTATAGGELAYPIPPPDSRIVVEVLNTTDRNGLGRVAARMLRQDGVDVVNVGNAGPASQRTTVIVRRGDGEHARRVARTLGGAEILTRRDTLRRVDLTIMLGADFRPVLPLHP